MKGEAVASLVLREGLAFADQKEQRRRQMYRLLGLGNEWRENLFTRAGSAARVLFVCWKIFVARH